MNAPSVATSLSFPTASLELGLRTLKSLGYLTAVERPARELASWASVVRMLEGMPAHLPPEVYDQFGEQFARRHPLLQFAAGLRLTPYGFAQLLARTLPLLQPLCFTVTAALDAEHLTLKAATHPGLPGSTPWWRLMLAACTHAPVALGHRALELRAASVTPHQLSAEWTAPRRSGTVGSTLVSHLSELFPVFTDLDTRADLGTDNEVLRLQRELGLTRAEARVALRVAEGLTPREIAAELGSTYQTVRTHLRNINLRLHLSSQRELAHCIERWRGNRPRLHVV